MSPSIPFPPSSDALPVSLRAQGDRLLIRWSDGQTREYAFDELRAACPCAVCRDERVQETKRSKLELKVLKPEQAAPVRIAGMDPVGGYAYRIRFSDGHETGIYSLDLLRELGHVTED